MFFRGRELLEVSETLRAEWQNVVVASVYGVMTSHLIFLAIANPSTCSLSTFQPINQNSVISTHNDENERGALKDKTFLDRKTGFPTSPSSSTLPFKTLRSLPFPFFFSPFSFFFGSKPYSRKNNFESATLRIANKMADDTLAPPLSQGVGYGLIVGA